MLKKDRSKNTNVFKLKVMIALVASIYQPVLLAGTVENTTSQKAINTALPLENNYTIPAGSLSKALSKYAGSNGLTFSFDPNLTNNKTTKGLNGRYQLQEGFNKLLEGTDLEAVSDENGDYLLRRAAPKTESTELNLEEVQVRAKRFYEIGPLPGLGLTKEEIPGNVQSISAKEIKDAHSVSMSDLFNKKLQSVTVNDYQGNPFQMDVQYRGFTAGPQIGTPQGLSVFFDGIRVNEPFGDVVNWDMIPMNAIASVDVFPGSNPIFGLNTLGGAFTVKTKDGFNNAGVDAEVLAGSYGRKQLQLEGGVNNGTFALFGAGNFFMEEGWREDSPSDVNQFFGKASYRGDKLDLNLSTLLVGTDLVGNGLLPSEEYARDRNSVFTSPDTTENELQQFQLSANYFVSDAFSITGQIYRRKSDRHQIGTDVVEDYDDELWAKRLPAAGEEYTCLFNSTNDYNLPDYYVIPWSPTAPIVGFSSQFFKDVTFGPGLGLSIAAFEAKYSANKNTALPDEFVNGYRFRYEENKNFKEANTYNRNGEIVPISGPTFNTNFAQFTNSIASTQSKVIADYDNWFISEDSSGNLVKNYVFLLPADNEQTCRDTRSTALNYELYDPAIPGNPLNVDGGKGANGTQPGVVAGTPTAIITDNQITQSTDGASVQFNWNLEKHKFMVGLSIDDASAEYRNSQRLGFFDANRKGYLDPSQAHPQFLAAFDPLENSNFSGTNTTKSIYFSETWSPVEAWNFNVSGRYNETQAKNKIATRYGPKGANYSVTDLIGEPDQYNICPNGDCTGVPTNFRRYRLDDTLEEAETEEFSYYSFNPSLGATWQAKENLNVYANWSQGTRVPSVIELGCASDHTPTGEYYFLGPGEVYEIPKSVLEKRTCYLPNTLSGDPYLPQIKATSYDIGMRGTIGESLQWNLGAYQTDLKDDIYFVAVGSGSGFFDTIGKTRRRGIEAGLSGQKDKWGFSVNYSMTDATFEDKFVMISQDNGTAVHQKKLGDSIITVNPGDTMPGVALHNLNASISYEVTPKWQVGMSAVAHSSSFVRGNENNKHKEGQIQYVEVSDGAGGTVLAPKRAMTNPGKLPGYMTFNFQTSYQFNSEWSASMLVNNVFDKEYFSAGRLGRNPFSPSVNGAIGPSGYNHNSNDWLSTNFIAPGAPRGIWFSLNWQFDPNKK